MCEHTTRLALGAWTGMGQGNKGRRPVLRHAHYNTPAVPTGSGTHGLGTLKLEGPTPGTKHGSRLPTPDNTTTPIQPPDAVAHLEPVYTLNGIVQRWRTDYIVAWFVQDERLM